jgi:hypothetical protein
VAVPVNVAMPSDMFLMMMMPVFPSSSRLRGERRKGGTKSKNRDEKNA